MTVSQMDPKTQAKTVKKTVSGNQGDAWHELLVDFASPTANYQVVITAVVGNNYTSDIAVDDLHWTTGACGGKEQMAELLAGVCDSRNWNLSQDKCFLDLLLELIWGKKTTCH